MARLSDEMVDGLFARTRKDALDVLEEEIEKATDPRRRDALRRVYLFIASPLRPIYSYEIAEWERQFAEIAIS